MTRSGDEPAAPPEGIRVGTGGRHLGRRTRPRALAVVALALVAVLVGGAGFAAVSVLRLKSNVETQPLNLSTDGEEQLPVDLSRDPVQILIIGSDTRAGQAGTTEPVTEEGKADVMMLMTMSGDRSNVTMVSFPRDLLVPLPACVDPETGETSEPMALGQLNDSLSNGGPGCTVAAINELTGLQIDHFMMADFNAVTELSEAVGGVEVCVNQPVDDEYSGLQLPAGTSEVEGEQALAFLRTRHSFGSGGDEGRIRAQQSFMASLARKIKEEGTLSNIPRLYSIAEAVTKNLTVDDGLAEIPELLKLAGRLQEVDLGNVAFVTVPVVPYEPDINRLVLDEQKAGELFADLRADRDITAEDSEPEPSASASTTPSASAEPSAEPSESATAETLGFDPALVPISVLNASGDAGRGDELQEILLDEGYSQAAVADTADRPATQLFVGPGYEGIAPAIADIFGLSDVQLIPSATTVGLELSVGSDFTDGDSMDTQGVAGDLSGQTAAQVTCQS
ncbi:LCP family protein required for cell wall assembly [Arthrobacter pigmenti]|uniref:LCP family protein required for cell wall assembly n=1 Tax=Arthrobacter pigmenti TaxID=271432 RepID=A0A846RVY4_9MICC|nr:LCP family protein [Arthrobacter pigmenti]NJC22411.1 LCP family protein required for cell wall assembly [Arthrobacter pigmenti]